MINRFSNGTATFRYSYHNGFEFANLDCENAHLRECNACIPVQNSDLMLEFLSSEQVWSNGKYKSPLHRVVVNESRARFSVPFFFNPAYSTEVAPVPELLTGSQQPKYRPINWGDFRSKRAKGDYADFGEEVQIAHYAIA
jgi:isopenicillin N synthase-like dioxygenase